MGFLQGSVPLHRLLGSHSPGLDTGLHQEHARCFQDLLGAVLEPRSSKPKPKALKSGSLESANPMETRLSHFAAIPPNAVPSFWFGPDRKPPAAFAWRLMDTFQVGLEVGQLSLQPYFKPLFAGLDPKP